MRENVKATVKNILTSYLELNKRRKTPERFTILDAVYSITGHFTLEELGDKLADDYNFPVSRATLYNTLRLFVELRLVVRHRFQSTTKYEACYDNNSHCHQICGYHVLTRLFMNKQEPNERGINEFIDQALAALQGPFPSVRKAAMQSVYRFAELGLMYERLAKSATKSINLEIF